jgi:hypothetical protein
MTVIFVVNAPVHVCVYLRARARVRLCARALCMCMYVFKSACEHTRVQCYELDSVKFSLKFHLILFYVLETWTYGAILFYSKISLHYQTMNLVYWYFT